MVEAAWETRRPLFKEGKEETQMTVEDQMFEVQQKKVIARAWMFGSFLAVAGILGFTFIITKHDPINVDACKLLCPNGIEKFENGSCYCTQPPKVEAPKPELLDCTCKPNWRSQ